MEDNTALFELFKDPVKWAEAFLRDPKDESKPLNLRSYQKDVLNHTKTNRRLLLRWGRRSGKSVVMCTDCLWWADASPIVNVLEGKNTDVKPVRILIATPYETQIKELWNIFIQLIGNSPLLQQRIEKIRTSDVHQIIFKNGSKIEGYTIGISSSNRGTSLRSLSADYIYLDEMDFIPTEIIEEVIMPIYTTHQECIFRVSSTPAGKRELYFVWATKGEELGWWTSHLPSWHPDNTNWLSIENAKKRNIPVTDSTEFQVKSITPQAAYDREYGAEFGEESQGVYKHTLINKALVTYGRNINLEDPDIFDPGFTQNRDNLFIIGVDWNSYTHGGQVVMLEYCLKPTIVEFYNDDIQQTTTIDFTGKYRVFYRRGIKSRQATQRLTREEIIRLMTYNKIDYVYVDYGAGDTNIEELTFYGQDHPELGMDTKLKVIDSGAVIEHFDPVTMEKVKKRHKSMMISTSVLNLEEGRCLLPKEEDEKTRLVGQMRTYRVKNVTARGEFSYEGDDHILDAYNLAIYGFQLQYGRLLQPKLEYEIGYAPPNLYSGRNKPLENINRFGKKQRNIRDPEQIREHISLPVRISPPNMGNRTFNIRGREHRGSF